MQSGTMSAETTWNPALLHGSSLAPSVRSVASFFNWPVRGVEHRMAVKEMATFSNLSLEDLGLRSTDADARVPQFFVLQRWPASEPSDARQVHKSSAEAQARDALRRKLKRNWQRQSAKWRPLQKQILRLPILLRRFQKLLVPKSC